MDARDRIVRAMLAHPSGMGLGDIAAAVGMAGPPVLHHLRSLADEGMVEKFVPAASTRPRYRLRPFLAVTWLDPASGTYASWTSRAGVDWRHPLVSRLPHPDAQESTATFLDILEREGLLAPPRPAKVTKKARPASSGPAAGRDDGLRIAAFGSAARGDMGPRSDVDLLALLGRGVAKDVPERLLDAAAEANLVTPMRIHLLVFREGELARVAPALAAEVRREGFVIHATRAERVSAPLVPEDEA